MKVKGNSLFGKLGIGLAGIFLLFVFIGCEKEKSVTGPTGFTTTEANIYDAAMAQSTDSTSRTFSMDNYKSYTGTMYVTVDPTNGSCQQGHSARIIWGPWQTDEVPLGYSNSPNAIRPIAIKFEKKNKDSVPLTVIVKECDSNIYYSINLYTLRKGETISTYKYKVYDRTKSGWTRR